MTSPVCVHTHKHRGWWWMFSFRYREWKGTGETKDERVRTSFFYFLPDSLYIDTFLLFLYQILYKWWEWNVVDFQWRISNWKGTTSTDIHLVHFYLNHLDISIGTLLYSTCLWHTLVKPLTSCHLLSRHSSSSSSYPAWKMSSLSSPSFCHHQSSLRRLTERISFFFRLQASTLGRFSSSRFND